MQKTKILYKVNQYIIGGSRIESYFFETEKEANEYYQNNEFVDEPIKIKMTLKNARIALAQTKWEINYYNFFNG